MPSSSSPLLWSWQGVVFSAGIHRLHSFASDARVDHALRNELGNRQNPVGGLVSPQSNAAAFDGIRHAARGNHRNAQMCLCKPGGRQGVRVVKMENIVISFRKKSSEAERGPEARRPGHGVNLDSFRKGAPGQRRPGTAEQVARVTCAAQPPQKEKHLTLASAPGFAEIDV